MLHALLRQDGGPTLILDGATNFTENYDGRVSDHPNVAREFIVNGRLIRPRFGSMEAIISPNPIAEGLAYGDARIQEVIGWLTTAKTNALVLSIQIPGRPLVENMVLETFSLGSSRTDSIVCSMSFKEVKIARLRSTKLTQVPKKAGGGHRPEVAAGQAAKTDKGTKPTKETSALYSVFTTFIPWAFGG